MINRPAYFCKVLAIDEFRGDASGQNIPVFSLIPRKFILAILPNCKKSPLIDYPISTIDLE